MAEAEKVTSFPALIEALQRGDKFDAAMWRTVLSLTGPDELDWLMRKARRIADEVFGRGIYIRGLIEISNYCRNGCRYCGIRNANHNVSRYRLSREEILSCCARGYELGFRTFVLQGGEDPVQDDDWVTATVRAVREHYPDCAITLSLGERKEAAYAAFRHAGADRYLLRHETASEPHYAYLHPEKMSFRNRIDCLYQLKNLGFQTGAGMMIGSPGQHIDCLVEDMLFLDKLKPEMIGVGPFIPAPNTPFAHEKEGSVAQTLCVLALLRMRFPHVLLPATTALSSLVPDGQILGLMAGANVIMPNLSPMDVRSKYALYQNKKYSGNEAAEQVRQLDMMLRNHGFCIAHGRGDHKI